MDMKDLLSPLGVIMGVLVGVHVINGSMRDDIEELETKLQQVNDRLETVEGKQAEIIVTQNTINNELANLPNALLLEGIRVGVVSPFPHGTYTARSIIPENGTNTLEDTPKDEPG